MAGLRENKKRQTEKRIMESAQKIFIEKGFQKTSMAEIAKDAEVGAGTLYNYFPSKGSLLVIICSKEIEQLKEKNIYKLNEIPDANLVEMIIEVLKLFTSFVNEYSKAFWREIFHAMTEEMEESTYLRDRFFDLDREILDELIQLIRKHSYSFLVPINPEDAVYAIYASVITDTVHYIYNENMTYEDYVGQMTGHIQFLFAGKLEQTGGEQK